MTQNTKRNNLLSRRKFLKITALAASVFTILPFGFARKSARYGTVQGNKGLHKTSSYVIQ
jgi:anaerobic selenocysteine-containing dehydrogenase